MKIVSNDFQESEISFYNSENQAITRSQQPFHRLIQGLKGCISDKTTVGLFLEMDKIALLSLSNQFQEMISSCICPE